MSKIVDYDAWQKLQLAPLTDFNPAVLQGLKYSQHSGYLLELERLYSTMYLEWPTLKKDASDMTEAVAGLTWTVAPFCQDGAEPDDEAKAVAKTVSDALWMVSPQRPGEFSHCFPELLGAMVHAIYRSVNVHEVVWKFTPELVYPLEYKQLGPQYYMWETRQGEPDRLMLVPDGMDYTRPVAFEPGRFVVALNTTGPDHPMYNADFYSLVGYFVAAKFGLPGLQSFVKRYGHPLRKFTIENKTRRQELEAKLRSMPDVYDVFLGPGETLDVTAIPAGANVPHEVLLRVAENACHQLIKGNTLTSDVGDSGGSRAQAEVHMGVEASLVRKRGEFVARVLNRQLIPYIVERNYGRRDLPMPELRCQVPEQKANIQKAQYWQAVLGIPGMRVLKSAVHDDLGIAVPGDGDDVYEGASAAAPAELRRDESAAPDGGMLSMSDDALDVTMAARSDGGGSLRERVERMLPEAMRRWAGPSIERFEQMVRDGRKPEEILARLEELRPDSRPLVDALRAVTAAGLGLPVDGGEDAAAANPYGCNQYGEGWSSAHDGNSTERVGKAKLLTHKDGDGNVRQIDTKKRYPGKGSYVGVGKDGKKGEEPEPKPKKRKKKTAPEPKEKKANKPGYAETREEAIEHTRQLLSEKYRESGEVSFSDLMSIGQINEFNGTVARLTERYPVDTLRRLGSYRDSNGNVGAHANSYILEVNHNAGTTGLFAFSTKWKSYTLDERNWTGGFTRHNVGSTENGITMEAVVTHEYGHVLHKKIHDMASFAKERKKYKLDITDEEQRIIDAQNSLNRAYLKAKRTGDIKMVSFYAQKNNLEFFAECFAARELGENLPDYITKALDNVIQCAIKKS